jgi:FHS family L-fucose permease-like MFS transporter
MMIAMVIFALAFLVIFFTDIPEPHMETAEEKAARLSAKKEKDPYSAMSFRHFVLGAVAIFFYIGVEVGVPNMANLYMSNNPLVGAAIAGTVVGLYWLMMMVGRIIGASIGGKVSAKTMLASVSLLAICLLLCVIFIPETHVIGFKGVQLPISMIFMFLVGLCTSIMWGAIFNLATEGLGKYTPAASGIFMTLVCGGGIIPLLQGLIADHIGYLGSYVLTIACLLYILWYALVGSKNVNKDIPTE